MENKLANCQTCFVTDQFPNAKIDDTGHCQWCRSASVFETSNSSQEIDYVGLEKVAQEIKSNRTKKYDCIIGVSGGLDSSYMAYIAGKIMGLNALLVHFDHGFFHEQAQENLKVLSRDLKLELRIYKSEKHWEKRFIKAFTKAFEHSKYYWGICTLCHYMLPATIVKVGIAEEVKYLMSHTNKYELSLRVPRETKLRTVLKSFTKDGLVHLPKTLFYLVLAYYYLLRIKFEFYLPPFKNIFRNAPKKPFKVVNLSKYVPWNTQDMINNLTRDTGWRLPDHPNIGMRFDCLIEESFINKTYKQATGSTVHEIIANNLIYDGVKTKKELSPAVEYYDRTIDRHIEEAKKRLSIG